MTVGNHFEIHFLHYHIDPENSQQNELMSYLKFSFSNNDGVALYDTSDWNIKLLCLKNYGIVNCRFLYR